MCNILLLDCIFLIQQLIHFITLCKKFVICVNVANEVINNIYSYNKCTESDTKCTMVKYLAELITADTVKQV